MKSISMAFACHEEEQNKKKLFALARQAVYT